MHWLGTSDHLAEIAEAEHAVSTLVIVTAFEQSALNRITRSALRAGLHVEMSTGLQGIAGDRLRWAPASRESLVYLEHRSLSKGALGVKRAFDIVVASLGLITTWPVIAIAAILIRRGDGGPVLFRQLRVGRDGQVFTLYKLRSMKPNAEAIKRELVEQNFRDGPLFKMLDDPRVTPIGRLLRLSSIDELPQLVNVLQGHMSIVGPRPALPEEVEQFDDDLLARHDVLPGVTGLWQLDARDHLSFDSYQRLDIHYVENWSIGLDITIFAGTIVSVIRRLWNKGNA
jgi:lipopolysaccharide/colanic/teichoic acid biosynthesis glycosyltransferase